MVRILLPPSEGKTVPSGRRVLDLEQLSLPGLTPTRERVLNALEELARGPADIAASVLGISPRQVDELERDRHLRTEPAAPARQVYSGVLYEALDLPSLTSAASRRATSTLLISSALFGMVRLTDVIPAYRLSGNTDLPGVGSLAALWREPLGAAIAPLLRTGLIVDLRSGAYAAHWVPRESMAARTVTVRVLQERVIKGERQRVVVSHHNKATKGRLVRALLTESASPRNVTEFVAVCRDLGFHAETTSVSTSGIGGVDIIVDEV